MFLSPPNGDSFDLFDLSHIQSSQLSSVTASAFLAWECLITFDDEVEYIWRKPNKSFMKWLYVFLRYFTAAVQITNLIIVMNVFSKPLTAPTCKTVYMFQAVVTQCILTSMELVLVIRVYALYNRNNRVKSFFFFLQFSEVVVTLAVNLQAICTNRYSPACIPKMMPLSMGFMYAAMAFTHISIWVMTLMRHNVAVRDGWGNLPVWLPILRDGTAVFALSEVIFVVAALAELRQRAVAGVAFSLSISVMSAMGCRLIINMQHTSISGAVASSYDLDLTTGVVGPSCTNLEEM